MDFTEDTATAAVQESFQNTSDPRLREIVTTLTRHLHEFVREIRPTQREWGQAIEFLTAVGHTCDDTRQEFVLLSDVFGVSMLIETINGGDGDATDGTVLGPFHMTESPRRELGDTIDLIGTGQQCEVSGTVTAVDGTPLAGAVIDVWQATDHGFYDVQQPGIQPPGNGRGLFTADDQGRFHFRTVVPSHYPIPTDGPIGRLLGATGRHPYRPAHIHFIASAPGYETVTTHVFVADSPYLDSDAVFAVKRSLVVDFVPGDDGIRHAAFDIALEQAQ
ncbi:dioxygenase [Antrihabitans stalactiti]|uniref:6-chlorohydroxyquinol-1,2-dioxygenase n=1 Tax=Antrihabitans stalactiti TaxID=2584121 RepID=A0A848KVL4_9NOCA|nr:dioxygenase [Antrihabitans stalactiti]NMN99507.1 6-chlorohydroxyquinol-1,2-dioxygenase [Antrihabitans stalactiti]